MVTVSLRRLARKPKLTPKPMPKLLPAPTLPPARRELLLPDNLQKGHLEHLASSCGLKIGGTKPVLRSRLCAAAARYRPLDHKTSRVLSIDMGIRNFGFAMLTLPAPRARVHTLPVIHAWKSLALDRDPALLVAVGLHAQAQAILAPPAEAAADGDGHGADSASPELAENFGFSPAMLSQIATYLVHNHLLPLRPTHVLIESQRYRTHGGMRIYEWTLRVNMLEAMLHSTFETLKSVGKWDGTVVSVQPDQVTHFLAKEEDQDHDGDEEHKALKKRKREPKKIAAEEAQETLPPLAPPPGKARAQAKKPRFKSSKIRRLHLLAGWLNQASLVEYGNEEAKSQAHMLLRRRGFMKREKRPRSKDVTAPPAPKLAKLDDLADCLLQNLVWLRWHENLGLLVGGKWETVMARRGMHGK